ncbi:Aspartate/tyrosine/aromatic aminotransferase [Sphingobium yanoikuyae]|uniref:Aspartate/tyrosine/aromatic aminotransferase n=1 Tax=Sphingobium yanoikuyae TaxID=13690 RepID=A0A084EAZ4_SPHYA|nr:amino acid aminotransferase [Sphingobium yanoikuyae]KEZ15136.1 Aspartate/tyrosine/aromatic aminotransferase [Sphingobium yanoikuyae]
MSVVTLAPAPAAAGLFDQLEPQPADSLLALIGLHRADPRPGKIDLGVGIYRDAAGVTPIMRAVKAAESLLVGTQSTKAYLGPEGDPRFTALLAPIVLGQALGASDRLTGVQTPGGTGALRLGADLLARAGMTGRVWIGTPTWPNHGPIFAAAGLSVAPHPFYDAASSTLDFESMVRALAAARAGDVVLLHGCCHNPTGTGFSRAQWKALASDFVVRGIVPFIDLAYQGLGDGMEEDAAGLRLMLDAVPEALVAYSCDKNFGLYRERVGALWTLSASAAGVAAVRENLLVLARSLWSMPPDHGAAVVRAILEDEALAMIWRDELEEMRVRIGALRAALASADPRLAPIATQRGLFAILPVTPPAVIALRERHGIYMAGSGRINIAGLTTKTIAPFVAALAPFLPE